MTTIKATVLPAMSELTIEERECVPAGCITKSELTAQVEQNDRTIGGNSFWRTNPVVKDMEMMDKELSTKADDIQRERLSCSAESDSEYCTQFETEVSSKTPDINITNNIGTVIVELAEPIEEHSRRNLPVLTEGVDSTPKDWPFTLLSNGRISSGKSREIPRKTAISASRKNRQKRLRKDKAKASQRQGLLHFCQRKRRNNIKSVLGKKVVNIHVSDNSGHIIIGDNVMFNSRDPELGGCGRAETRTLKRGSQNQSAFGLEIVESDGVVSAPLILRQPVIYIDKSIMVWLEKFYRIANEIHPLRDNGRWQDFYHKVDTGLCYSREHGLQEEEIFLTVQKSIALSFQKKNDESKKMVKQANDMIFSRPRLNMREFLVVLSHCQLAALYRRQFKLDKAKNAVSIAEQNVEFLPSHLARSYVTYQKASNWFVQYSHSPSEGEQEKSSLEAKKAFKKCISVCEQTLLETDSVYLRKHHFCLVKLALMYLSYNTRAQREKPVSEENVSEATKCINRMVERYTGQICESTNMLLHSAQSGLSYRQGDYARAEQFACKALNKAKSLSFDLDIQQLEERLNEMRLLNQANAKICSQ